MKHKTEKPFVLAQEALQDPDQKRDMNAQLFDVVAPKYDFITRALSLGRDVAWKRHLIRHLPDGGHPICVDLACGTGDVCFMLAEKYQTGHIIGTDLTHAMLSIAHTRSVDARIQFVQSDMMHLNFASHSVDIVTGSYAIRNAPDLGGTLDEIARILKPGGVGAFLDFSKPATRWVQPIQYAMLKTWGNFWGWVAHKNADVYGYIADSLKTFPDRSTLHAMFVTRGLRIVRTQRFYGGIMELIHIEKSEI